MLNLDELIKIYIGHEKKTSIFGPAITFEVAAGELVETAVRLYYEHQLPLKMIMALDERSTHGRFAVMYVFAVPGTPYWIVPIVSLRDTLHYPSLVSAIHEAMLYERKIFSFFGLIADGHPGLERILLHPNMPADTYPLRKDFSPTRRLPLAAEKKIFPRVRGEGMYEISVGPIHAGIIEPGHFRFNVAGEEIVALHAFLGYTHKGTEKLFESMPWRTSVRLAERVSGDTSFTQAWAYCQALESLGGVQVSLGAEAWRVIFSELERLANHLNDIGFIMQDTAYNFGGSQCGRLREQVMQLCEKLTGSRHLRGMCVPGGIRLAPADPLKRELSEFVDRLSQDFDEVMAIASNSTSMMNRLEGAGTLSRQVALDHGAVGLAAKACGIGRDARREFSYGLYPELTFDAALEDSGDVLARFGVRVKEISSSLSLIRQSLDRLEKTTVGLQVPRALQPNALGFGIAEGWRGDIVYCVATDARGEITRVAVRDPSFLNWSVVPHAVRDNVVPDFPLINKSFNLSYSGNDL